MQVIARCRQISPSHTCHWRQRDCSSRSTVAEMRRVRESAASWTALACTTSHRQRVGWHGSHRLVRACRLRWKPVEFHEHSPPREHIRYRCHVSQQASENCLGPLLQTLIHPLWRATKVDARPTRRIRARVWTRVRGCGF